MKDKTDKLIKESILLAVDSIREDIQSTADTGDNLKRAEAILKLMTAYSLVR